MCRSSNQRGGWAFGDVRQLAAQLVWIRLSSHCMRALTFASSQQSRTHYQLGLLTPCIDPRPSHMSTLNGTFPEPVVSTLRVICSCRVWNAHCLCVFGRPPKGCTVHSADVPTIVSLARDHSVRNTTRLGFMEQRLPARALANRIHLLDCAHTILSHDKVTNSFAFVLKLSPSKRRSSAPHCDHCAQSHVDLIGA